MKKIIIFALIGFSAWNYYSKNESVTYTPATITAAVAETRVETPFQQPQPNFSCDGREHCSQMTSKEEALYFLRNCPNTKMDGDNDGDPCERQF